ncbi:MAG: type II toxin-antitoxin system VapC family toxin [Dehalococcoidia bacterium]
MVAAHILREIDHSGTHIERISVADELRARSILAQFEDKDFSLTDATCFAVMDRLNIRHASTFDHNFAQYGLTILTVR